MFFSNYDVKIPEEYLKKIISPVGDLNRFIISNYVLNDDKPFIKFKVSKPFDFFDKGVLFNDGEYKSLIYLTKNVNGVEIGRFIHFMLYINITDYYKTHNKMPILNISLVERMLFNKLYRASNNSDNFVVWMCPATGMICANGFDDFVELKQKYNNQLLLKNEILRTLGYFPDKNKVFCSNFLKDQILFICTTTDKTYDDPRYAEYTNKVLCLDSIDMYVDETQTLHQSAISFNNMVVTDKLYELSKPSITMNDIYDDTDGEEDTSTPDNNNTTSNILFTSIEREYLLNISLVLTNNQLWLYNTPSDIPKYLSIVS